MTPQAPTVTAFDSKKIVSDILVSAFTALAQQVAENVHTSLDLPIVDQTQKNEVEAAVAKANEQLDRINSTMANRNALLSAIAELTPQSTAKATTAQTREDVSELSTSRKAMLVLTTTHVADVNFVMEFTRDRLGRMPLLTNALFLRIKRDLTLSELNRQVASYLDETTPEASKKTLLAQIDASKAGLADLNAEVSQMVTMLKNNV